MPLARFPSTRRSFAALGAILIALALGVALPASSYAASVPSAPGIGSHLRSLTSTTVLLNPIPDDGGSPLTGYIAEYSADEFATWTTQTVPGEATQIVFTGLKNSTTYRLRVAAINAVGQSAWANNWITGLYRPGAPSIESVAERLGELEIRVFPGGIITSETVTVTPGNHRCVLKAYQTLCNVAGLKGGQTYSVQATGTNPAGTSPASATVRATAAGHATALRSLKAKVATSKGVRRVVLSWKAPANLRAGTLKGIIYSTKGSLDRYPGRSLRPWPTSLVLNNVKRGQTYTVHIAAMTFARDDTFHIRGAVSKIKVTVK